MEILTSVLQVVIGLGILNVWMLRFGKSTAWRGGDAKNMREEFAFYGLPPWFMWLVGGAKVLCAVLLLGGLFVPALVRPAAAALGVLMLGAVCMHVKVRDPLKKALPSIAMLILCGLLLALAA